MRQLALPAAALLVAASTTVASAGAGLPKVAEVQAGPYRAALHNDSPAVRKGGNTLTVEIPSLPPGQIVALQLRSSGGQLLRVPLVPLVQLQGDVSGHDASAAAGELDDHHGAAHGTDQMSGYGEATAPYMARGRVSVPTTGTWEAQLTIRDGHGDGLDGSSEAMYGHADLDVVEGGPNPWYLGATGSLMGGALLFGAVQRRRGARRPTSTASLVAGASRAARSTPSPTAYAGRNGRAQPDDLSHLS
jgi:hypothetical protein